MPFPDFGQEIICILFASMFVGSHEVFVGSHELY
jgi:hypothetical protein